MSFWSPSRLGLRSKFKRPSSAEDCNYVILGQVQYSNSVVVIVVSYQRRDRCPCRRATCPTLVVLLGRTMVVPPAGLLDGANVWNRANTVTRECSDRVPASPPRGSHDIHHRVFWLAARVRSAVCPNVNSSATFAHRFCLLAWGTSVVRRSPSSAMMPSHSRERTSSSIFSTTSSQTPALSSPAKPQALPPTSTSAISTSMLCTTPPNAQRYSRTKWSRHLPSQSNWPRSPY